MSVSGGLPGLEFGEERAIHQDTHVWSELINCPDNFVGVSGGLGHGGEGGGGGAGRLCLVFTL